MPNLTPSERGSLASLLKKVHPPPRVDRRTGVRTRVRVSYTIPISHDRLLGIIKTDTGIDESWHVTRALQFYFAALGVDPNDFGEADRQGTQNKEEKSVRK